MLGTLEHGQFPFVSSFVQAHDVEALVRRFDFDVTVVRAAPAIERLDDVNLTPAEMNAPKDRHPVVARIEFYSDTHG
jgi:hypothetical protein